MLTVASTSKCSVGVQRSLARTASTSMRLTSWPSVGSWVTPSRLWWMYDRLAASVLPAARFTVVSFVWGPGQATPVHDHRTWGLVGVLRGAEVNETFAWRDGALAATAVEALPAGQVSAVSPTVGDIHRVADAFDDRVSISIHVYGGNIGTIKRATYDADGHEQPFVSGFANTAAPDLDPAVTPSDVRAALLARHEIALIDLRDEDAFARGHPLFPA